MPPVFEVLLSAVLSAQPYHKAYDKRERGYNAYEYLFEQRDLVGGYVKQFALYDLRLNGYSR